MKMKKLRVLILCFTMLLTSCGGTVTQPSPEPTEPPATAEIQPSPQPTEPPVTVSFPPAGEMLEVECGGYAPLEDNGSRTVTIWYADYSTERETTYDLTGTKPEVGGPVLTILRETIDGAVLRSSTPVTDQAERAWLLDTLERAEFQPVDKMPGPWEDLVIYVEEEGRETRYRVYGDGTLDREGEDGSLEAARQAVDRDRISALAYKYGSVPIHMGAFPEEWLAETMLNVPPLDREGLPDWWDDSYPHPPAAHYQLCVQGERFHVDLDREQADILLTTLFGEGHSERAAMPDLIPADVDWMPGEGGIRLTERLVAEWTRYEDWAYLKEDKVESIFYLYPDGTAAFVPMVDPIYVDRFKVESITPSWRRVAAAEDAFSWDTLTACLGALGVA